MSLNIELINKVLKEHWQVKPSKGGRKMLIRTRKEIKNHQEMIKKRLEKEVEKGLAFEKMNDKEIASLNEELEFVSAETCYEDTHSGKIEAMERNSFAMIDNILHRLSKYTGKEYFIEEGS